MKHVVGVGNNGRWLREKSVQGEPARKRLVVMLGIALAATSVDAFAQVTAPSAGGDITSLVTANDDISLQGGNYTVNLPTGVTTYSGLISGTGTLTVDSPNGASTLVLTQTPTYTLPAAQKTQTTYYDYVNFLPVTYDGLTSPNVFHGGVTVVSNPDPASLTIGNNTTLQLGNATANNVTLNNDILDNGTLLLNEGSRTNQGGIIRLGGTVSGSGGITVLSPGGNGGIGLSGVNTYTGPSLFLSDGANVGGDHAYASTPDTDFIVIKTSYLPETPVPVLGLPGKIDITQNIWEVYYENDINLDAYTGLVMFRGVYSYTDSGDDDNPSLSNPKLNFTSLPGNASERGVNIEGSIVQFGDGTTSQMFISGNADNTYINLHNNGILGFDYNGTTTLNTAIGGGQYFGSLSTPGIGDIVITGNASNANHVIFTQGEYYNGLTQIDAGTTLQLGDDTQGDASGTPGQVGYYNSSGGNSSLLTADNANGLSTDRITDNGTLIVDNTVGAVDGITAVSLSNISGSGSLQQIGNLPLTLLANTTYTGATTIGAGSTLYLGTNSSGVAGSIASSSGVALTGTGATLDISQATAETLQDLSGAAGSIVALGSHALTVGTADSTVFAGAITDGGIGGGSAGSLIKIGSGTLVLSGANTYTGGTTISGGMLQLGTGSSSGSVLGDIVDQGTLAFDRSDNAIFSGVISGSGGLLQAGSGTTALTAVDTYTGTTEVASGDLQVDGTITSDVQVDAGATLSGTGQVGGINVFGNLLIGDAAAAAKVMSATRTVTFNPGSQFQIYIDPTGAHSLLQINGSAVLKGGNVSLSAAAGTYTANQSYQILAATGGVTGTFSGVLVNSLNLTPTLKYQANGVYLVLEAANAGSTGSSGSGTTSSGSGTASSGSGTVTVPTGTASLTPLFPCSQLTLNQCHTERALQMISAQPPTALVPALNALVTQTLPAAKVSLDAMNGQIFAEADTAALRQMSDLRGLVAAHAANATDGQLWMQARNGDASLGSDGNAQSVSLDDQGSYAGLQNQIADWLKLGAFVGQNRANLNLSNGDHARLNTPQFGFYLAGVFGPNDAWYGNANMGYANPQVRTTRYVTVGNAVGQTASASYHQNAAALSLELGYRGSFGSTQVVPFVAYDGAYVKHGLVQEDSGQSLDVNVHGDSRESSVISSGLHLSQDVQTDGGTIMPELTVAIGRQQGDAMGTADVSFEAAPGTAFRTDGVKTGRLLETVSGGLSAELRHGWTASLDGTYAHASHENDRGVKAQVALAF